MRIRFLGTATRFAVCIACLAGAAGSADEAESEPLPRTQPAESTPAQTISRGLGYLKDNPLGSFYLKLRPRFEHADQSRLGRSAALTMRTVAGLGTRSFHGLSLLAEGEAVITVKESLYFDGVSRPNGRTLVPDPRDAELNQLYLDYRTPWAKSGLRVGRQRILIDDQRFVGNLGFRQNEMTMDAARASSSLGISDLSVLYVYLQKVRRSFGNRGGEATRDFESNSHLAHVDYRRFRIARIKAFGYWLDFDNAPMLSSQTYGIRLEGQREVSDRAELSYVLSYAHQWDAAGNQANYDASYQLARLTWTDADLGAVTLGFERLGSDAGEAVFSTPLSTAHGFNGFADAFLDNGGPNGVREAFVEFAPFLPWQLVGSTSFHWFQADNADGARGGSRDLGWEVDALVSRPINRWATLLLKTAYFDGRTRARPTRIRAWIQLSLDF